MIWCQEEHQWVPYLLIFNEANPTGLGQTSMISCPLYMRAITRPRDQNLGWAWFKRIILSLLSTGGGST
jgi:hypothetical protein